MEEVVVESNMKHVSERKGYGGTGHGRDIREAVVMKSSGEKRELDGYWLQKEAGEALTEPLKVSTRQKTSVESTSRMSARCHGPSPPPIFRLGLTGPS